MTDVFISYAREDRSQAAELAQLLEEAGYTVWWDWRLVGGSQYREIIDAKLTEARKVIVLWSVRSVGSAFVIDEAQEAKDKRKLIPIVIDASRPPLGFRDIHTLYIKKFHAVSDAIIASIEDKSPVHASLARRITLPRLVYAVTAAIVSLAAVAVVTYSLIRPGMLIEPVYKIYNSAELGVTLEFPTNVLSLDTTERKQRRLTLRDGDGRPRIRILRTGLPSSRDIKLARQQEIEQLEKLSYTLTYIAPEHERNWKNWYVLSGITNNTVFYFRRWYVEDSVVSIEFIFPKELAPLYDKLIPAMTQELSFTETSPSPSE